MRESHLRSSRFNPVENAIAFLVIALLAATAMAGLLRVRYRSLVANSSRPLSYLASRDWLRCVLLAVLGFAVHLPALQGDLIWDDLYLAKDNPMIKSPVLILEAFRHYLFLDSYSGHYRPVQTVSYIFDYWIWNSETYGFHLTNILFHIASGLLLYFLVRRLLEQLADLGRASNVLGESRQLISVAALLLAAVWIVHPVHSAAVDYISGRADSLAFLFAGGGWLLYLRAEQTSNRTKRNVTYGLAAVCLLLSLCSRETGCLWLLLFLLYLFLFNRQATWREKVLTLTICLLATAAYGYLRELPEKRPDNTTAVNWPAPMRATLMLRALGDYGRLMVVPMKLHMERTVFEPATYLSSKTWRKSAAIEYLSIGGVALLATFSLGSIRRGRGQRVRIFGALWFIVSYLPTSNLFELNATVAEHWLYLPSVGFLLFFVGCAMEVPQRFRRPLVIAACFAVIALSARCAIRSSDWVDPETFFRRTFAAGGTSSRIAVNLAVIYATHGEHSKAEALLRKVLQVTPDYPLARNNLATALYHLGKIPEAEAMFAEARKMEPGDRMQYPRTWDSALNLASMRHNAKDDQIALDILDHARADYPGTWDLIRFEAEILRETRGPDAALTLVEKFASEHWWHPGAALALGHLYSEKGENARAEAAFRRASWLDVHDVESLNLIAALRMKQGHFADARRAQNRAIARQPDEPRQYLLLADILRHLDRQAEAENALARCYELEKIARVNLAKN